MSAVLLCLPVLSGLPLPCHGAPLESHNSPADFRLKLERRAVIDRYQLERYATEEKLGPTPYEPAAKRAQERRGTIRSLHSRWDETLLKSRASLKEMMRPLRGYRAPIFSRRGEVWPATLQGETDPNVLAAAQWVEERLAQDGLLPTLAAALGKLKRKEGGPECDQQLRRAGFPADLVRYFEIRAADGAKVSGKPIIGWVAKQLAAGRTVEAVSKELREGSFRFEPSLPGFRLSVEDGSSVIRLLRMQIGGGYVGGILPGSSLDFAGRLIDVMPDARVLMSIEETYFEPCHWLAARVWPLRRVGQLTLIGEPLRVSAWAQDNGKPGYVAGQGGQPGRLAAMTPRFASHEDGESLLMPGESFLMEGVQSAGLDVTQSPLLYQGGDLMAVKDPRTGKRVLLLGEGEVHRNTPLGLTREQVIEAFRVEMNVDECAVWPEGSFHLDYDVTFRSHEGRLLAFVNDPGSAARTIVEEGLAALEKAEALPPERTREALEHLQAARYLKLQGLVEPALKGNQNGAGQFRTALVKHFAREPVDSAAANFQCFLTSLDYLCATDPELMESAMEPARAAYLRSLQAVGKSLESQKALLGKRGWEVIPVPSMPDLNRSINYLNGLQDKGRYIMPAWGGFYQELDSAAAAVFGKVLGKSVQVIPIQCAESQVQHGSIHCMVKAYPEGE